MEHPARAPASAPALAQRSSHQGDPAADEQSVQPVSRGGTGRTPDPSPRRCGECRRCKMGAVCLVPAPASAPVVTEQESEMEPPSVTDAPYEDSDEHSGRSYDSSGRTYSDLDDSLNDGEPYMRASEEQPAAPRPETPEAEARGSHRWPSLHGAEDEGSRRSSSLQPASGQPPASPISRQRRDASGSVMQVRKPPSWPRSWVNFSLF